MRAIDADALKDYMRSGLEDMRELFKDNGKFAEEVTNSFCKDIDEQPTIETERRTGHWVYDENGMDWNLPAWKCDQCHARNDNIPPAIKYNDGYRKVGNPLMWQGSKFCPNCGAKMEEA